MSIDAGDSTQGGVPDGGAENKRDGGGHREARVVEAAGASILRD